MKKNSLGLLSAVALAALGCVSTVEALEFSKPVTASIITNPSSPAIHAHPNAAQSRSPLINRKTVTLMNIQLSPGQRQALMRFPHENLAGAEASAGTSLPRKASIGMNGVPVLDQGKHGACVTFANTAVIDALLGKGDYVSQLCNLSLGNYFSQKGYLPSGWSGTLGPMVLDQMIGFGIVNKATQKANSCGGLKEYPLENASEEGSPMSLDDFKLVSENLNENAFMFWDPLLSFFQRFQWGENTAPANALLTTVKKIIAIRSSEMEARLSFAALLPVDHCSAGACGRYHASDDSWVLSKEILRDSDLTFGGHEMVITGYDDDAVAVDHDGKRHQGLLILRNSWGEDAGDHGDYYMSYDFFKSFVVEVQEIVLLSREHGEY